MVEFVRFPMETYAIGNLAAKFMMEVRP